MQTHTHTHTHMFKHTHIKHSHTHNRSLTYSNTHKLILPPLSIPLSLYPLSPSLCPPMPLCVCVCVCVCVRVRRTKPTLAGRQKRQLQEKLDYVKEVVKTKKVRVCLKQFSVCVCVYIGSVCVA